MYSSQWPWIELYASLYECDTVDAYTEVLEPWTKQHADERQWLADFSGRTQASWSSATNEDLCRLYAIFRVTSVLLLRFQRGSADGSDYPGPAISVEGYQRFHEALGFHAPHVPEFHPFYHEIVAVQQAASPAAPIEVIEERWPPLMLGSLMFCRAGCVVAGGTHHVVKEVAERSKMYWTYRRKDRPYSDLSHGWGSNSRWRTAMRRDYRVSSGFHYNVDGEMRLDAAGHTVDGLSLEVVRELVRNRCMIRTEVDDSDLNPYGYADEEAVP